MNATLARPTPRSSFAARAAKRSRCGYSLVEAMIGMGIFGLAAVGLIALALMVRRSSEEAVYHNTALTLAQAYLEQIRSIDYNSIQNAAVTSTAALTLRSSAGTIFTDESGGLFTNGEWARETIMLDEADNGQPRQPMTFRFRPVLTDLASSTSDTALGIEIVLYYETTYDFGSVRTHKASLRTVRSNIPTY